MKRATALVGALGIVAAGATFAVATPTAAPPMGLAAVGPVSGEHGFPVWYEDSNGLRLEQCLDLEDPMCDPVFLRGEMQDPTGEMSFPDNFPMESFYMAADSLIDLPSGGSAGLTLALEATFAQDDPGPAEGDQMVFGRVRIRVDTPSTGTYTVTHPYGVDTFNVSNAGEGINYTQDIGASVLQFGDALESRINPFLVREEGLITTENGNKYIGDPAVPTRVTGSLLTDASGAPTNYFRIEGPDIGGPGVNMIETDLFSLMGKVSTNSGVVGDSVTYSETAEGAYLDVHATAGAGDSVNVSGEGFPITRLVGNGDDFYARIPLTGAPPASVTITNASDVPVATRTVDVTDQVVVNSATYDVATQTLNVSAATSDQVEGPALSLEGLTNSDGTAVAIANGSATVTGLVVPPASVTVTSAGGGSDSAPVVVTGAAVGEAEALTVVATGPSQVMAGQTVTLDGSSSYNATSYEWKQIADPAAAPTTDPATGEPVPASIEPAVTLTGADQAQATFTAPAGPATLWFTLTVNGPGGPLTSDPVKVEVVSADAPPVAAATASLSTAMVGQEVTLDGSGSTNAATYQWTQTSGTAVEGLNLTSPTLTFTMPATVDPISFSLVVTSPTGTASEPTTVSVTPVGDTLGVTSAQYRSDKREWRIEGTATITNNNNVTVYLQNADGTKGTEIGSALVEAPVEGETTGTWGIRVRGGVAPNGANRLMVESSRGGVLKDVTFSSRN